MRLDPDDIPRGLLEKSVEVLDKVIEAVDQILPLVTQTKWIVAAGCFGMFIVNYLSNLGETTACWGIEGEDVQKIETMIRGSKSYNYDEDSWAKFEELNDKRQNNDGAVDYEGCAQVKQRFLKMQKTRRWLCDRIFCPVVPSLQKFAADEKANDQSTSACVRDNFESGGEETYQLGLNNPQPETIISRPPPG